MDRLLAPPTLSELLHRQQAHFRSQLKQSGPAERIARLRKLRKWVLAKQPEIRKALYADFHKPAHEVDVMEILPAVGEINHVISHLRDWMRPKQVGTPISLIGTRTAVHYEPKGCSLILGPFNFPFMLVLNPLISAIAAGCTAILKPSEFTPHTSALLLEMCKDLFPEEEVACLLGDHHLAQALTALPFDHIFFTGSPEVGKKVMHAAADNLASVTLELGGRNPVIVDETAAIKDTARKLVWGKYVNAGQSCMSPNYIMVHERIHDRLVAAIEARLKQAYPGPDMATNPDYTHVINARHHDRLQQLIQDSVAAGAEIVAGGQSAPGSYFLAPTVLKNVQPDNPVMQQEIFGPIMAILKYTNLDDALRLIRRIEKPLGLYIFSRSRRNIDKVMTQTSSGCFMVNETTIAFGHPGIPMGGVNFSGLGKAHGHAGFLAFTNEKPVIYQSRLFPSTLLAFPPYAKWKSKILNLVIRWF